jgi:hypothetical protein
MEAVLQGLSSVSGSAESEASERRWVNMTPEMGWRIVEGLSLGNGEVRDVLGLVSKDKVNGLMGKVLETWEDRTIRTTMMMMMFATPLVVKAPLLGRSRVASMTTALVQAPARLYRAEMLVCCCYWLLAIVTSHSA